MKRSVLRATFLLVTVFCLILLYLMANWTGGMSGIFKSQDMSIEQHSPQQLLADVESINFLMDVDISGNENNGPRKYTDQKIVHLDLKGMPLLPKYMVELFPFLKQFGAHGLLIEYEDMFPFEDILGVVRNKDAYTKDDIRYINQLAEANNLEIIPLVQTFGHMEYVLKLEEFEGLREAPRYPQVICPTNNNSLSVVKMMVDQVISLHPNIKYLHIGSDEVYFLGMCPLCIERMRKDHLSEPQLFLDHVKYVANYVTETYSPLRVLMWDDEFRKLEEADIIKSGLGQLVDIVVWNYGTEVDQHLPSTLWKKYVKCFENIWMGSAFKGADQPDSMVVNETHYLANQFSWINLAKEQFPSVKFKGVVITGWQRYDHFSVPCEILPVAIPSLASCLTYMTSTKFLTMNEVFSTAKYLLYCGARLEYCTFPGARIHDEVKILLRYQLELKELKKTSVFRGWLKNFHINNKFSSPSHIENILQSISRMNHEVRQLHHQLSSSMSHVFPKSSIEEWMQINFEPLVVEIGGILQGCTDILDKKTFPIRPLESDRVLL